MPPADWPKPASLPTQLDDIWDRDELSQLEESEAFLQPHEWILHRQFLQGPALAWSSEVGERVMSWFPGLNRNQLADRLNLHSGHFGRILNGREPWTLPNILATCEHARLFAATLPEPERFPAGLGQLPPFPTADEYRRHSRKRVMACVDLLLREHKLAGKGQLQTLLKAKGIKSFPCWQFELLDATLSKHAPEWLRYCRRFPDLAPALLSEVDLQALVKDCAMEASRAACLPGRDKQRLVQLPEEISLGYAACREIWRLFRIWQKAWKYTNDYVQRWEK
jgi:hypothetical protein